MLCCLGSSGEGGLIPEPQVAAVAQEVQFGHLERLLHSESLCRVGTGCRGVLLSPSLAEQSLG